MAGQTDVGFNTIIKMWFLQFMDELRWILGSLHVRRELRLKNVIVDGFTWPDLNARTSHGRFRFYEENKVVTEGHGTFADTIDVTGPEGDAIPFREFRNVEVTVKYNLKTMDWSIMIGDEVFASKNLVGKITSKSFSKEPIICVLEPCDVLHSHIVTLINCGLRPKGG